mgnify:CR=1 FL=1
MDASAGELFRSTPGEAAAGVSAQASKDAGRRAALYDEIVALGAQAFMTGTGPELFTELGERALHIEVRDEAGQSRIEEIKP